VDLGKKKKDDYKRVKQACLRKRQQPETLVRGSHRGAASVHLQEVNQRGEDGPVSINGHGRDHKAFRGIIFEVAEELIRVGNEFKEQIKLQN